MERRQNFTFSGQDNRHITGGNDDYISRKKKNQKRPGVRTKCHWRSNAMEKKPPDKMPHRKLSSR